uniref:phosphatidylinositol N-acetylglucosaminyltransferase n=1 Tax=Panagrellus redivivus TaxID=6233 RepID=A0A7E4VYN2_PANRE
MRSRHRNKLTIALVSDFFCPNTGGVETHIYYLGECLLRRGHKVIVLTHAYGQRKGIRYFTNGLKVYYLPFFQIGNGSGILSSVVGSLYWLRRIYTDEAVDIVHGHSAFSALAHEAMFHAWCLGIKTVFTDHSLFGFADASAILTSKLLLQYSLINIDRFICVSYTSKENTVLRAKLNPDKVYVIPNAIEKHLFTPDPVSYAKKPLTVIVMSRLVYRKGADLLVDVIPEICARHPTVQFIIAGDGPKRVPIEEMREKHKLHSRCEMVGMLPHNLVRDLLIRGQIFLNTSLTEAFCTTIVEAASCGLHIVSTAVGGVPEVLSSEFITLAKPDAGSLTEALLEAIDKHESGSLMTPLQRHERMSPMYRWPSVATRTEVVYYSVMDDELMSLKTRLSNYFNCGRSFGMMWTWFTLVVMILIHILDFFDNLILHTSSKPSTSKRPQPQKLIMNGQKKLNGRS